MKALKVQFFKALFSILAMTTVLSSCAQSSKNTGEKESPKIDIHTAVLSGNIEAVKQHIEVGSDLNVKEPMTGSTPLITATTFGKTEIANLLIDAGSDLSLKNNDGATALHVAAFFGRIEIVQALIDAKADKSIKNNYGATARESIAGPFKDVKPIYEMLSQQLKPMGLVLDFAELEKARPVIAMMLQ